MTLLGSIARPLAALIIAGGLAACSQPTDDGTINDVHVDPVLSDVVMGQATAPVTIVEYASLTCPHCRDFWKQELPQLKASYIDTGKVKYILRELPTPPTTLAVAAAGIARCAGKDHYYDVIDDVYSTYHKMMDALESPAGAAPVLVEIGGRHGLNVDQVRACARSKAVQDFVAKEVAEKPNFATHTPTLIIDGAEIADTSYANLSKTLEAKLNPAATPEPPAPAKP